jgi:hypothetical protein
MPSFQISPPSLSWLGLQFSLSLSLFYFLLSVLYSIYLAETSRGRPIRVAPKSQLAMLLIFIPCSVLYFFFRFDLDPFIPPSLFSVCVLDSTNSLLASDGVCDPASTLVSPLISSI